MSRPPAGSRPPPPRPAGGIPTAVPVTGAWETVFAGRERSGLERVLRTWLRSRRWFAGKERQVSSVRITATVPLPNRITMTFVTVSYAEGDPDTYVVPLGIAEGEQADGLGRRRQVGPRPQHALLADAERAAHQA